ncbi:MAG: glucose 1-dehydrogenase [Acidobacteriota bacterium]|nr:glucose 1-dehydrogenase [Acidobacteriota bacterium]
MAQRLTGKVAVVTGASKGIGASIAKYLAAEGASVVVNYSSSKEGADKVVKEITGKGGKAVAVQGNVAKQKDIERLFAEAKKAYGKLDILINNAGVYEFLPLENVTDEHFHRLYDLNVLGLLLTSKEAARYFGAEGGSIVNISSVAGIISPASASVYASTKAAVDSVTRSLAKEFGPRKIRVNSINPGLVITEGVESVGFDEGDFRKTFEAQSPLGRVGLPEDIAPAAVFLASGESSWITGETLVIAGGVR